MVAAPLRIADLVEALGPAPAPGYCLVPATVMHGLLRAITRGEPSDRALFVQSWHGMPQDTYMADGGRYRFRRHAVLRAVAGEADFRIEAHKPHYQSRDYNTLNGGVERWFEPIPAALLAGPSLVAIIELARTVFSGPTRAGEWQIEAHQFRIQAKAGETGHPTPEGIHRDGVDYVLVMLIARHNIASGTTTLHHPDGTLLDRFTLTEPGDSTFLDDRRCLHGVTPVTPIDPCLPAYRDVLVVTFKRLDRRST